MRLYILGKSRDDKGSQLEELTRQILEHQGFTNIVKNSQHSGANEIDVRAEKENTVGKRGVSLPVICECKAHNRPIDMEDWLKFIGKLYIERRKNRNAEHTIGLMIALFGANGCVQGSAMDDFACDDSVQLIANEDLFNIISELYSINRPLQVKEHLIKTFNIQSWDIDIAYYDKKCYLIVSLDDSKYTICNTSGDIFKGSDIEEIVSLINEWTDFRSENYLDIWKKEETAAILRVIESTLYTAILTLGSTTIEDIQKHIVYSDSKSPIPLTQIKEAAIQSTYIKIDENNGILSMSDIKDVIPFINHVYEIGMQIPLFSSEKFQDMITLELLNQIKLIQFGIDLDEKEQNDCLFLIKHSPSALLYAINVDNFLHSYQTSSMYPGMKKVMHNHFFCQLLKFFEEDFSNPTFSSLMRNSFSIVDLYTHTRITIKDDQEEREIGFEQELSLVPLQGSQQPLLISHIIDKKQ